RQLRGAVVGDSSPISSQFQAYAMRARSTSAVAGCRRGELRWGQKVWAESLGKSFTPPSGAGANRPFRQPTSRNLFAHGTMCQISPCEALVRGARGPEELGNRRAALPASLPILSCVIYLNMLFRRLEKVRD